MKTPAGKLPIGAPSGGKKLVVLVLALGCTALSADTWDIQTVDFVGDVGRFTSLALDTLGFPHISYHDVTNAELKYAYHDANGWHFQTVDDIGQYESEFGYLTSLALDTQGFPHVAYCRDSDLCYAYMDPGGWHVQFLSDGNGLGASLVLDSLGFAHISHGSGSYAAYSYQDISGWSHEFPPGVCATGLSTSLVLDALSGPHITYVSYAANDYCMRHAYKSAGSWQSEVVEYWQTAGAGSSLHIDASGVLHVTHVLVGGSWNVKYAWKDASGWQSRIVDQIDYSMMQWITSLELDGEGNPHVCYMRNGYDLVIQHWNGLQWNLETVDSDGQVGMHPSMILDASDRPHISYYDITNGDLKYARLLPKQFNLRAHLFDGQLLLSWEPVSGISSYWVFGVSHEPWFAPDLSAPTYINRLAIIPPGATTWSSDNGVGDPGSNWTYLLCAMDDSNVELVRSNRVGEHDFEGSIP